VFNIGSGTGHSVLEVVKMMEEISGVEVPLKFEGRREGDVGNVIADVKKAWKEMGWKTEKSLRDICADAWRYEMQSSNITTNEVEGESGKKKVKLTRVQMLIHESEQEKMFKEDSLPSAN
jgi:hypothetical protein